MTIQPKSCTLDTNLSAAVELMYTADCGVLPVIEDGKLAGIITDRDISVALGTRNARPAETSVGEVATRKIETCGPEDDVEAAMATMRRAKVRRLPVVRDGKLVGVLALNDLILAAGTQYLGITCDDVMETLKAVSEHRSRKTLAERSVRPLKWPAIPVAVA